MYIKICAAILLFCEVYFFAQIPYIYAKFTKNRILTTFISCFSSGLFLGLSFLHVLPQANSVLKKILYKHPPHMNNNIQGHNQNHHHHHQHQHKLEIGSIIAISTFVIILGIETYFHNSPKYGKKYHKHDDHDYAHDHDHHDNNYNHQRQQEHQVQEQVMNFKDSMVSPKELEFIKNTDQNIFSEVNMQVLLTQLALSIHSFFQCMSIGVQKSHNQVLTLAIGILIHKWAQALTLGFAYKSVRMSKATARKFSLIHSFLNGGAIMFGWIVSSGNDLIMGILSSVSAGTFLYVCMIQKIKQEFSNSHFLKLKMFSLFLGITFVCFLD